MSFFSPSYPRFLILVFYTKFCTRHFAHVVSNLHSHLVRQVLPSPFHIWGNWASKRFANFSKVTQWISGWPHFSMEPLAESLIHGLVLEVPALSYFALPLTLILFWLSTAVFAWIPVETEGAMRGGQIWEVLPRSWHERLRLGTEGDRRAKGISTSSTWESRTAMVSPKEMGNWEVLFL